MSLLINSKDIYIPNNMCYKFALSKSRMPRTYHGATNSRLQLLYDPQKRFGCAGLFYFLFFGWWGYRHGTNRRAESNTRPWRANPTLVSMTQHCDGNVFHGSESIWACLLAQCQQISRSKILQFMFRSRDPLVFWFTQIITFVNFVDITPSLFHSDLWVKANMRFKVTIINAFS